MDYTAYNMRSYFSSRPGQPTHCPHCQQALTQTDIEPSDSVQEDLDWDEGIPAHDFSLLFVCPGCGWWMIRESWDLCEIGWEGDFLAVGNPGPAQEKPWLKALADPELYRHALNLPQQLARIFPTGKRK